MDNQIFYMVILNTWNYEWEDFETYYFKTEEEANLKAEKLEKETYHCKHSINVSQITFEKMKETITVNEFEELFGIIITADGKIVKEN